MVIFNSYVKLPEGKSADVFWDSCHHLSACRKIERSFSGSKKNQKHIDPPKKGWVQWISMVELRMFKVLHMTNSLGGR